MALITYLFPVDFKGQQMASRGGRQTGIICYGERPGPCRLGIELFGVGGGSTPSCPREIWSTRGDSNPDDPALQTGAWPCSATGACFIDGLNSVGC